MNNNDAATIEELVQMSEILDSYGRDELSKCAAELLDVAGKIASQEDILTSLVALANELDSSDDPKLNKYASVLDEILLTIGSSKDALAQASAKTEDEINKIREEHRAKKREELYGNAKKEEDGQNKKSEVEKAYKDQVKTYRTMEAPLSTRYCPDHPGASVVRIADHVYQCSLDKKIYNYDSGFKTNKGNDVPGGGVEYQTKDWGQRDTGPAMFDTRESAMSRFASFGQRGLDGPYSSENEAEDAARKFQLKGDRAAKAVIGKDERWYVDVETDTLFKKLDEIQPVFMTEEQAEAKSKKLEHRLSDTFAFSPQPDEFLDGWLLHMNGDKFLDAANNLFRFTEDEQWEFRLQVDWDALKDEVK